MQKTLFAVLTAAEIGVGAMGGGDAFVRVKSGPEGLRVAPPVELRAARIDLPLSSPAPRPSARICVTHRGPSP
jgi:hypothetical protein